MEAIGTSLHFICRFANVALRAFLFRAFLSAVRSSPLNRAISRYSEFFNCPHSKGSISLTPTQRAAIAHQLTNALTEPLFASALSRAKEFDAHFFRTGTLLGPLHGLPVTVKDSFDIAGVDSSIGIASLCFKPATQNAPLVDALLALGAVIIAKTNIPQTLGALDSDNNVFGRVINPLNRRVTAGGSSGGEGVMAAMRGSVFGIGTDIGGSIRIPAMCNGVYGFKPSVGRFPYGGQQSGIMPGTGRTALQAVAGPIAARLDDIQLAMSAVMNAATWRTAQDVIPGPWSSLAPIPQKRKDLTIGIIPRDGLVEPLPPVTKALNEVRAKLLSTNNVRVLDIDATPAFSKCQSLANKLMGAGGNELMASLLTSTGEPPIAWLQSRFKPIKPVSYDTLRDLLAQRSALEREWLQYWTDPETGREVDVMICPVAPHPVPGLDRWNAVGYTSSFVLLDYPAASMPIRMLGKEDLEGEVEAPVKGSWDKKNRELCKSSLGFSSNWSLVLLSQKGALPYSSISEIIQLLTQCC